MLGPHCTHAPPRPREIARFLREGSTNAFFKLIFDQQDGTADPKAKTTVSKFNNEIERFFKVLLDGAQPQFIRCINPKPKGTNPADTMNGRYNLQRVLGQLMYTGILDTVEVRKKGYAIRKKYSEFACQWIHPACLLDEADIPGDLREDQYAEKVRNDEALGKEVTLRLLSDPRFEVPKEEWECGKSMIFVKKLASLAKMQVEKETLMQVGIARLSSLPPPASRAPLPLSPLAPPPLRNTAATTPRRAHARYYRSAGPALARPTPVASLPPIRPVVSCCGGRTCSRRPKRRSRSAR